VGDKQRREAETLREPTLRSEPVFKGSVPTAAKRRKFLAPF
jgi:hypothetical protein